MNPRLFALPALSLGLCLLGQETPAPVPPTPAPAPAPAPVAPNELETLQARLRQATEDQVLRMAELRKSLEALEHRLKELAPLPEQVKHAVEGNRAASEKLKVAETRLEGLEKQREALLKGRLEAERIAFQRALKVEGLMARELQGSAPLAALEGALARVQEGVRLSNQPAFKSWAEGLRDKFAKNPVGSPFKDPASASAFFANGQVGHTWALASVLLGGGWDSDRAKNLDRVMPALDLATRMEVELRVAALQAQELKLALAAFQTTAEESLLRHEKLIDPSLSAPLSVESEAFAPKLEAHFKTLAESMAAGTARSALLELAQAREEVSALLQERRTLLNRAQSTATGMAQAFQAFRSLAATRESPALGDLVKAAEDLRGRLKSLGEFPVQELRELLAPQLAGF